MTSAATRRLPHAIIRRAPAVRPTPPRREGLRRIAGISASLLGTQALTSVLGLVFWTLAARSFAASAVGVAGAAVALMTLLGSLGSLGLGTVLISRLPVTAAGDRRVLVRTCLAAAGLGGGLLAAAVPQAGIAVFGATSLETIVGTPATYAGFVLGTVLMSVVLVLDQAVLTVGVGSLQLERNLVASLVKIVALLALPMAGLTGGMSIFLAWTIGNLLSLLVIALRSRGPWRAARWVDPTMLRGLGRTALSHHALNTTLQSTLQLLPVIVTLAVSEQDNAWFNAALMVCGFVFALPYAIAIGVFASAEGDERAVLSRLPTTLAASAAISVAAYAVLYPLAGTFLSVFGRDYAAHGETLLRILTLAGVPFVVKDHFVALRRVQGRTTGAVKLLALFLVVELAAAVVGARLGGAVGLCAAWVSVMGVEALALAVPLLLAHRRLADPPVPPQQRTRSVPAGPPGVLLVPDPATTRLPAVDPKTTVLAVLHPLTTLLPAERKIPEPAEEPAASELPGRSLLGPIFLLMALGVAAMSAAAGVSRLVDVTVWWAEALWIAGQVLIVLPATIRVVARATSDRERVAVALLAGLMLQVSRIVLNPVRFTFHDEQLHTTTWRQIDGSAHLFGFNPLLPVSAYYPGLEIVTDAVCRLTGLSMFVAANLVLGAARVVLLLALMCLIRVIVGSYRASAVAAMVYLANPQLLFFNSQFSYQTLALPLAILTMYTFVSRPRARRWAAAVPAVALACTILTHHLTAMLVVGAFLVWLVTEASVGRRRGSQSESRRLWHRAELRDLGVMVAVGVAVNAAIMALPGSPVVGYLVDIFTSSGAGITGLAETGQTKAVFADKAGNGPAPWEQVLLIASVLITCMGLLAAFLELRASLRSRQAIGLIGACCALLYPLVPGGHLTSATAEVGDRAAGFVFVGLAIAVGAWTLRRRWSRVEAAVFGVLLTVTFLGSVILGAGPTARQLPGPYLISADSRSMDASNLAAAEWEANHLPPAQWVFADRVAGLLASSVGGQLTVRHLSTGIDASRLLLEPTFGAPDVDLIRRAHIAYLIVDNRISGGLPHLDVYVESGEYLESTRKAPVPAAALVKFATVPGVTRIYDNGALQIYDVRALLHAR